MRSILELFKVSQVTMIGSVGRYPIFASDFFVGNIASV